MIQGVAAIKSIAEVLNSDTRRKRWIQSVRDKHVTSDESPTTPNEVALHNVTFKYSSVQQEFAAVHNLTLHLPAGEVICFPIDKLAGHGQTPVSCNSLFKLIQGDLVPQVGEVIFPRRWRVIHVPVLPVLFDGTLMYNLSFGNNIVHSHSREQVWDLCKALGLSKHLMNNDDFDCGRNGSYIKFTDRLIISIVRALVHDVDVLLISSALDVLGDQWAVMVLRRLRLYVRERGLPNARLPADCRHEKTIVYMSRLHSLENESTRVMSPVTRKDTLDVQFAG